MVPRIPVQGIVIGVSLIAALIYDFQLEILFRERQDATEVVGIGVL